MLEQRLDDLDPDAAVPVVDADAPALPALRDHPRGTGVEVGSGPRHPLVGQQHAAGILRPDLGHYPHRPAGPRDQLAPAPGRGGRGRRSPRRTGTRSWPPTRCRPRPGPGARRSPAGCRRCRPPPGAGAAAPAWSPGPDPGTLPPPELPQVEERAVGREQQTGPPTVEPPSIAADAGGAGLGRAGLRDRGTRDAPFVW